MNVVVILEEMLQIVGTADAMCDILLSSIADSCFLDL